MGNPPEFIEASRSRILTPADLSQLYRATQTGPFRALRADYESQPTPPDGGGFLLTITGNERQRTIRATGANTLPPVLETYISAVRALSQ